MLITENSPASSGFWSTSTFATTNSGCSSAISSTIGETIRQGPHQVAKKSIKIVFSVFKISLKFSVVTDRETRLKMYPHIKYAGYIPDWDPEFEETPPVFIIVLNDTNIKTTKTAEVDSGAAVAHMCLAATELGIDTCWFGSVGKKEIKEMLSFPEHLDITYVLGLGYGAQTGEYEDIKNNDHRYYFDENGNVRGPKRSMEEILIKAEIAK